MDFLVSAYGAVGDGTTDDTRALQSAIDACAGAGGGRVVLESGHTYLSASLRLRANVELHLEGGSLLKASRQLDTYFRPDQPAAEEGVSHVGTPVVGKPSYVFLHAKDAPNVRVTGFGVIDGSGDAFVRRVSPYYVTGDFYPRPTLMYLENCPHLTVRDVTMRNVPFWTLHIAGCEDALIDRIRILNDLDVANSDGIDVDHSRNVRILGCHIECADDCICLKNTLGNREYPHTRDVIVSDCTLVSTSAAIKLGTEGVDDFENVVISRCVISRSNRGISIQIRDGGCVRNVSVSDVIIETRRFAENWWGCAEPIAVTALDRDAHTPGGTVSDVRFFNVTCRGENGVLLYGEAGRIRNVLLDNVSVSLVETSRWPKHCYDLRPGATVEGLMHRVAVPVFAHGVTGLRLLSLSTQGMGSACANGAEDVALEDCSQVSREA